MFKLYNQYNFSENDNEVLSYLERSFNDLNLDSVINKKGRKKSEYVASILKMNEGNLSLPVNILSEQKFVEGISDAIDVIVEYDNLQILIEIDNLRADQIAKKVFSRTSSFNTEKNILFITLCYTSASKDYHKKECLKYIDVHFKNYFLRFKEIKYLAFIPECVNFL